MEINPSQIVLQLGIAGLIVWVGFRIAMRFIDRWAESENARTKEIGDGFKAVTSSITTYTTADQRSHSTMSAAINENTMAVVRLEGKIDATLDWQDRTPVEGVKRVPREGTYYHRPSTKPGENKKG